MQEKRESYFESTARPTAAELEQESREYAARSDREREDKLARWDAVQRATPGLEEAWRALHRGANPPFSSQEAAWKRQFYSHVCWSDEDQLIYTSQLRGGAKVVLWRPGDPPPATDFSNWEPPKD